MDGIEEQIGRKGPSNGFGGQAPLDVGVVKDVEVVVEIDEVVVDDVPERGIDEQEQRKANPEAAGKE
ncbi:hypothetical protein HY522_10795 [bacterium]|nr:hypothetical protein [bacterium]